MLMAGWVGQVWDLCFVMPCTFYLPYTPKCTTHFTAAHTVLPLCHVMFEKQKLKLELYTHRVSHGHGVFRLGVTVDGGPGGNGSCTVDHVLYRRQLTHEEVERLVQVRYGAVGGS